MSFARRPRFDWKLRTRSLALGEKTLVMGILNVTPDSFSDGGRYMGPNEAIEYGISMLDAGADVLDVGGESTRPGATAIGSEEELRRVMPVIAAILKERPGAVLSIDTYHAETARVAVEAGAEIVNDVSGGLWDEAMLSTVASLGCGVVLMHTRGRPEEWVGMAPLEAGEATPMVFGDLRRRAEAALAAGIAREAIVLDPGFGFGKMGARNYELLGRLDEMKGLGYPVLAGLSRKGFLARAVAALHGGVPPVEGKRGTVTAAANTAAVLGGAHVLRVHHVVEALEAGAIGDAVLGGLE